VVVSLEHESPTGAGTAWLYGIARNLLKQHHKRGRVETAARRRLGMTAHAPHDDDLDAILHRLDAQALQARLDTALDALPDAQRRAVDGRVVRELAYDDLAGELTGAINLGGGHSAVPVASTTAAADPNLPYRYRLTGVHERNRDGRGPIYIESSRPLSSFTQQQVAAARARRPSDTRGGNCVLGVRVVHHLDGLAVTERCEVGAQRRLLAVIGVRSHDHDDLVAGVHDVDELTDASAAARPAHELQRLLAVVAGACRVRVAAMPFDVRVEEVAECIEVAAQCGVEAAPS
jgi:hypothetical protein